MCRCEGGLLTRRVNPLGETVGVLPAGLSDGGRLWSRHRVLGGGISLSAYLFLPATKAALEGATFEVRIAELGDQAPLAGAGVAWFGAAGGACCPVFELGTGAKAPQSFCCVCDLA